MSDRSALLTNFARAFKAAARAVSLYPDTHPAIRSSLSRVTSTAQRLTAGNALTISVLPDTLSIGDPPPERQDASVGELAVLLHERLVGELAIAEGVAADDWRALLLILAKTPEELAAGGGIARAWAASGQSGFAIREIDYAEVLRERSGQGGAFDPARARADWDRIISCCLQGDTASLDARALEWLFAIPGDASRLAALLDHFQHPDTTGGASMSARAAALLHLLRAAVEAAHRQGTPHEQALQTIADASARLTPDMVLSLLAHRQSGDPASAALATGVLDRMSDRTIASFVANSIVAERAATERLAFAFQALVPDAGRRDPLLAIAHDEAATSGLGAEPEFEQLWLGAARMLTSYSDEKYVSAAYARELSGARQHAIEVDRVSDDPPDRVQAWLATITPDAISRLDLDLILDLTRVESRVGEWTAIAAVVLTEIDRRTVIGDLQAAHALTSTLVHETSDQGRDGFRAPADAALDQLAAGPLVPHMVRQLRKGHEADVQGITSLCQLVGPRLAQPLAEALATEQQPRAIRYLRQLLLGFGGREALPELTAMLDDADPQVQRESIRAIFQIGTAEAYAVLQRALVASDTSCDYLAQQLIGVRDERAIPLLCHVVNHTRARGALVRVHIEIMDALGGLGDHRDTIRTLAGALTRGEWWAPRRTAALRAAAAKALRRIDSPAAISALEIATARGGRGVRAAVAAVRERARA